MEYNKTTIKNYVESFLTNLLIVVFGFPYLALPAFLLWVLLLTTFPVFSNLSEPAAGILFISCYLLLCWAAISHKKHFYDV